MLQISNYKETLIIIKSLVNKGAYSKRGSFRDIIFDKFYYK